MTDATDIAAMPSRAELQAAADWVARLGGEPGEGDWLAFEQWLMGSASRRVAYDRVMGLSLELDAQAEVLADALDSGAERGRRHAPALWWSAGVTAMAAVAVTVTVLSVHKPVQPDLYSTARGERRQIVLSDGTRVALNTGTSIQVRMRKDSREITLAQGEAAFTVVHDASRPFVVQAGDRVMRDLGTDFDVRRGDGRITVTVREGLVSVQRPGNSRSLSLGPGSRLEHREGFADSTVLSADTDEAFSWRSGRLIYRDRPLAEVAADLSRYGDDQVKVQGSAAAVRFSGVLTIDNQSAMAQRLTALLPVATARKDGVIVLSQLNNKP